MSPEEKIRAGNAVNGVWYPTWPEPSRLLQPSPQVLSAFSSTQIGLCPSAGVLDGSALTLVVSSVFPPVPSPLVGHHDNSDR